jgi:IS66 Orf2 like protein
MIPVPSGVRVWLAVGRTDMRRGMNGLALQVQEALGRDPHAGDLYVFRGVRGNLIKILWHDGIGNVALRQEAREGSLHLAIADHWRCRHLGFPARLHARRNRLEEPGSYLPTGARRIVAGPCIF